MSTLNMKIKGTKRAMSYAQSTRSWKPVMYMNEQCQYEEEAGFFCSFATNLDVVDITTDEMAALLSGVLSAYHEMCAACTQGVESVPQSYVYALPEAEVRSKENARPSMYTVNMPDCVVRASIGDNVFFYDVKRGEWIGGMDVPVDRPVIVTPTASTKMRLSGKALCKMAASFVECFARIDTDAVKAVYCHNMMAE